MTVRELIEMLMDYDPDWQVLTQQYHSDGSKEPDWSEITDVIENDNDEVVIL